VDQHDHEYDLVRWFPMAAAQKTLTYGNEAEMVRQARTLLEADRAEAS
jgi:hypothetical protein